MAGAHQLRKISRKFVLGIISSLVLGPFLQVYPVLATHVAPTQILLTSIQQQVITGVQSFGIGFQVSKVSSTDPRPAEARVTLTIRAPSDASCFLPNGPLVVSLASNISLSAGTYGPPDPRFTWTGLNSAGTTFVPNGTYCFYFTAVDGHGTTIFQIPQTISTNNAITVLSPPPSGSSAGTGTGTSGTVSGPVTQSRIQHTVHPAVIDLFKTPPDIARIDFTVLENLPGLRMTVEVYGPDGFLVQSNFPDFPTGQGSTGNIFWNGSCSGNGSYWWQENRWCNETANNLAESGIYQYKFFAGGQVIDYGQIVVTNVPPPPPPPPTPTQPFIVGTPFAQPPSFEKGGSTAIFFTTGKTVSNLQVEISRNANPAEKKVLPLTPAVSGTAPAGNYVALWDGRLVSGGVEGAAPAGNYTYALTATGESAVFGTVTVVSPPVQPEPEPEPEQGPFIVTHSGFLQTNVGVPVTLAFTTGRTISGLQVKVKNATGTTVVRELVVLTSAGVAVGSSAVAGTYVATWDAKRIQSCDAFTGLCTLVNADAGAYQYEISATGQTSVIGQITVNQPATDDTDGTTQEPPPIAVTAMQLTNLQVTPSVFIPASGQSVTINFTVNQDARVDINVWSSVQTGTPIITKNLLSAGTTNNVSAGTYSIQWNGHSSQQNRFLNQTNDNGTYTIIVDARGTQGQTPDTEQVSVVILNSAPPPPPPPPPPPTSGVLQITNLGANPSTFNPDTGSNTDFRYQLSHDAQVTVRVYPSTFSPANTSAPDPASLSLSSSQVAPFIFQPTVLPIRTIELGILRTGGNVTHNSVWNGRDDFNTIVPTGTYPYVIRASRSTNINETVYSWGLVMVFRGVGGTITTQQPFMLTDLGPTRPAFFPDNGETTTLRFEVNRPNTTFVVTIETGVPGTPIRTLSVSSTGISVSAGQTVYRYESVWDGRNAAGSLVSTNTYAYRIKAFSGSDQMERVGWVRVERTGTTVTITTSTNCAGFVDVPKNHSLCPAIEFVVSRGIFLGDGGLNTLRLDDLLKRSEASRVMQSAFGYSLEPYSTSSDGNLGFSDLNTSAWYMPYIKTFVLRKVLEGYPDGLMRANRTMGRAEMYKVFVEGTFDAPLAVPHFSLRKPITNKPFTDTPVNKDTKWYLSYADFANVNDLVTTSNFFPGKGISRGTVIKLIYDTHVKGLITYGQVNPNPGSSSIALGNY